LAWAIEKFKLINDSQIIKKENKHFPLDRHMQTAWIWIRYQVTRHLTWIQDFWHSDNIFYQLWVTLKHF